MWPISYNVVPMGTSYFSFIKLDPVSGSWTKEITASIILVLMRTGAFSGGIWSPVLIGISGFLVK